MVPSLSGAVLFPLGMGTGCVAWACRGGNAILFLVLEVALSVSHAGSLSSQIRANQQPRNGCYKVSGTANCSSGIRIGENTKLAAGDCTATSICTSRNRQVKQTVFVGAGY